MKIDEQALATMWDEALDQNGTVTIPGAGEYSISYAYKMVDPIGYRVGMSDYADALIREGYEIEGY